MAHNITFSRTFPAYHPKAGRPTYFAETLMATIVGQMRYSNYDCYTDMLVTLNPGKERMADLFLRQLDFFGRKFSSKKHTIRAGHRWRPGMIMSARIWTGTPYRSPQLVILPPVEIVKTYDIRRTPVGEFIMPTARVETSLHNIAENDALNLDDFKAWFHKPFEGQIICWSKFIDY